MAESLYLILGIFLAASFVQGFTGFGAGILAMALLTMVLGIREATVLVNLLSLVTVVAISVPLRGHIHWRTVAAMSVGIIVGVPLGVWVLTSVDPKWMQRGLGVAVVVFAAWSWLRTDRPTRRLGWPIGLLAGAAGGALSGMFCVAGPPLVAYIYSQPLQRDSLKSTINACFLITTTIRLIVISVGGQVDLEAASVAAGCVVPTLGGVLLGLLLARRVPTEPFRRVAWLAFGLLGLVLTAG